MRLVGVISAAVAGVLVGAVAAWIDPSGRTILTDGDEPPVAGAVRVEPEDLATRWKGNAIEGPQKGVRDSSRPEDRLERQVRGALADLQGGDAERGLAEVRRLHRRYPSRPDLALALAEIERRRGRFESAERILREVLTTPATLDEAWEGRIERALRDLQDEIETAHLAGEIEVRRAVETPNFQLTYDHRLAGRSYGAQVGRLVEEVRSQTATSLGRTLSRRLEVRLYTRGQYLEAHQHRFGFATVGFFDGAIHVVTARHPRGELLALLTHEYAHALFEEALGGHKPFFLNEGIAEREEERVRGRTELARGEWWKLLESIRTGTWIPLGELTAGFSGLEGTRALLAYLQSRAAIQLLEERYPGVVSRWLTRSADGENWERALIEETGWDVVTLDAELRQDVRGRFPESPLHALGMRSFETP
jgi:hypothetical protein